MFQIRSTRGILSATNSRANSTRQPPMTQLLWTSARSPGRTTHPNRATNPSVATVPYTFRPDAKQTATRNAAMWGAVTLLSSQHQPVGCRGSYSGARIHHREILIVGPQFEEIAEERTFRLSRLAGHVRDDGAIPVGDVDDFAIAGAVGGHGPRSAGTLD